CSNLSYHSPSTTFKAVRSATTSTETRGDGWRLFSPQVFNQRKIEWSISHRSGHALDWRYSRCMKTRREGQTANHDWPAASCACRADCFERGCMKGWRQPLVWRILILPLKGMQQVC